MMLCHTRFVMGRVHAVDTARRLLTASTLAGDLVVPYTHLVLAFGNRARDDLVPGAAEHALPLKTVGDAMHIRNTVLRRVARIELETTRRCAIASAISSSSAAASPVSRPRASSSTASRACAATIPASPPPSSR